MISKFQQLKQRLTNTRMSYSAGQLWATKLLRIRHVEHNGAAELMCAERSNCLAL